MSMMKTMLEDRIAELSTKSGYSEEFLMEQFFACVDEARQDGVAFDFRQFEAVTLECDW